MLSKPARTVAAPVQRRRSNMHARMHLCHRRRPIAPDTSLHRILSEHWSLFKYSSSDFMSNINVEHTHTSRFFRFIDSPSAQKALHCAKQIHLSGQNDTTKTELIFVFSLRASARTSLAHRWDVDVEATRILLSAANWYSQWMNERQNDERKRLKTHFFH